MNEFERMKEKCRILKEQQPHLADQVDDLIRSIAALESTYGPHRDALPDDSFVQHMEKVVVPMLAQLIDNLCAESGITFFSTNIVSTAIGHA